MSAHAGHLPNTQETLCGPRTYFELNFPYDYMNLSMEIQLIVLRHMFNFCTNGKIVNINCKMKPLSISEYKGANIKNSNPES